MCNMSYEDVTITTAPGPGAGQARIGFERQPLGRSVDVVAGRLGAWTVEFTAGQGGIAVGGGVALWGAYSGFRFDVRPQAAFPERRGYVTASTTGRAQLELHVNSRDPGHTCPIATVLVRGSALLEGDVITFRFNDRSQGSPGGVAFISVMLGTPIYVGVDANGSGIFVQIADSPLTVNVVADQRPARYLVLAPSTVSAGEVSSVQVVALDACGNLAPGAAAQLSMEAPGCSDLPDSCFLSPLESGRKQFRGVSFPEGVSQIKVLDQERQIEARSNPICCEPQQDMRVFWGDIHNHAYDSSLWLYLTPTTDPDYNYRYAREISRLDFFCLNFHLFLEHGFNEQDRAWQMVQEAAAQHHQPGEYVTFSGFEYHGFGGDRCQIFNGDLVPGVRLKDLYGSNTRRPLESAEDVQRLFDFAADTGSMVTCHVGGNPTDFRYHDPRAQWSVEVASMHGNFEFFAQQALQKGLRVGFHGSSDGHVQTPGQPRRPGSGGRNGDFNRRDTGYGSGALMAVLAPELTRTALWEAFRARRTYATTGARIVLDFRANGQLMGQEITSESPPVFTADVVGTGPIERLELIRNDRLLLTERGDSDQVSLVFTDETCPRGENYYYLRVSQVDGEFAWSSPIWVWRTGGPAGSDLSLPLWNADDTEVRTELPPREAQRYEQRLLDYLRREEDATRWESLQAVRLVPSPMGRYVLLLAYDRKHQKPVHFKLFLDYGDIILRMDLGWRDFGQYPNPTATAFVDYQPAE